MDEQGPHGMSVTMQNEIRAGTADDFEDGEFDQEDWDARSVNTFQTTTSSVLQHEFEHGRRYHHFRYGRYPIPNDDVEQDRENLKHVATMELTDGKMIFAPLGPQPQRILDLGTGTGQWAIEVADRYATAEVVGIDLSPIQPTWVPPNVRFVIDDMEDEWVHGGNFDLIHARHVFPVLSNVGKVLAMSYENLKPGGWVDIQEFGGLIESDDGTITAESGLARFMDMTHQAMLRFDGKDFRIGRRLGGVLAETGFVNVQCQVYKMPIGAWAKDRRDRLVGKYMEIIMGELIDAVLAKPVAAMELDEGVLERTSRDAKAEMADPGVHAYVRYYFYTAQKRG